MPSIALLGTGLIGAGLSENMLARGLDLTVWNRTAAKTEPLVDLGAKAAPTAAAAVEGAAVVHLAFTADAAVDAVLADVQPHLAPGAVVIDHSTTSPEATATRLTRAAAAGVRLLHCPVFMSPQMCREGGGLMLACGAQEDLDVVEPHLKQLTGRLWYVGPEPQRAAALKLFGNAAILGLVGVLADIFQMAREQGIEPEDARALFDRFNPVGTLRARGKKMAAGDFAPSFALTMARKDVGLMLETAGDRPLAVLPGVAARMDALIEAGAGDLDCGVLARGD